MPIHSHRLFINSLSFNLFLLLITIRSSLLISLIQEIRCSRQLRRRITGVNGRRLVIGNLLNTGDYQRIVVALRLRSACIMLGNQLGHCPRGPLVYANVDLGLIRYYMKSHRPIHRSFGCVEILIMGYSIDRLICVIRKDLDLSAMIHELESFMTMDFFMRSTFLLVDSTLVYAGNLSLQVEVLVANGLIYRVARPRLEEAAAPCWRLPVVP